MPENTRLVCFRTGILGEASVERMFQHILQQLKEEHGYVYRGAKPQVMVCYKKNGRRIRDRIGYSYVLVTDPAVVHACYGRNFDGTRRETFVKRQVPNPHYQKPSIETAPVPLHRSWADVMDEEEEFMEISEKTILQPLFPEAWTSDYTKAKCLKWPMSSEELNFAKTELKDSASHVEVLVWTLPEQPDPNIYSHHALASYILPEEITEDDLKLAFSPFASDSRSQLQLDYFDGHGKKKKRTDTYPAVQIRFVKGKNADGSIPPGGKVRRAFIRFDPSTFDARIAAIWCHQMPIKKNGKDLMCVFVNAYSSQV